MDVVIFSVMLERWKINEVLSNYKCSYYVNSFVICMEWCDYL